MPRQVIQIDFGFSEPMQSNVDYADDAIECADELIASLARNGSIIGDGASFWSSPDTYTWIGYSLHSEILATTSLTQWSENCLAQLRELACVVRTKQLEGKSDDIEDTDTRPQYLVLTANRSNSVVTDSDGFPFDLFSITLDASQRQELSDWNDICNALYTLWLTHPGMEDQAYEYLADYKSEINSTGIAMRSVIEQISGIPTYYFLLRSSVSTKNEFWRNCPQCGKNWCSLSKESPDCWNFEFRCDACRLVSSEGEDYEDRTWSEEYDEGYCYFSQGRCMSPDQKEEMENRIAKNPDDMQARQSLIGFFHGLSLAEREPFSAFPHIIWLVKSFPDSYTFRNLYLGKPYSDEQNDEFARLWLEQIHLHPSNDKIVGNAGISIRGTNEQLGWQYIQQAAQLNPKEEFWARTLAHHFADEALEGDLSERKNYAEIAIREAQRFFGLPASSGERFSVCHDVTPVAIEHGYLNEARSWNYWVRDHMTYSTFTQFGDFALIHLAQIELADGKPIKSKLLLRKALNNIQENTATAAPGSYAMMALLDKLLILEHREIVIEALQLCVEKAPERKIDQLRKWLDQLKQGKSPKLEFSKRHK